MLKHVRYERGRAVPLVGGSLCKETRVQCVCLQMQKTHGRAGWCFCLPVLLFNTFWVAPFALYAILCRWHFMRRGAQGGVSCAAAVNTRHPAENCPSLEIYPLSSFMVFRPHGVPARLDYSRIGGALKLTPLTSYHHHMVPMLNSHGTRKSLLRIQNYISWVRIGRPA